MTTPAARRKNHAVISRAAEALSFLARVMPFAGASRRAADINRHCLTSDLRAPRHRGAGYDATMPYIGLYLHTVARYRR